MDSQDLICMWGRALAKVTRQVILELAFELRSPDYPASLPSPINRLVDKRELCSLKADLGVSGLIRNFSPIRSLPSASNTLFVVPFSLVFPE